MRRQMVLGEDARSLRHQLVMRRMNDADGWARYLNRKRLEPAGGSQLHHDWRRRLQTISTPQSLAERKVLGEGCGNALRAYAIFALSAINHGAMLGKTSTKHDEERVGHGECRFGAMEFRHSGER